MIVTSNIEYSSEFLCLGAVLMYWHVPTFPIFSSLNCLRFLSVSLTTVIMSEGLHGFAGMSLSLFL